MQLILDAENSVDSYKNMANLDETVLTNGISDDVKEASGNKEDVENIDPKDKSSGDLITTIGIESDDDKITKASDKISTENTLNEKEELITNEFQNVLFNTSDENIKLSSNTNDILEEDLKIIEKPLGVELNTQNAPKTEKNGCKDSHLDEENVVQEVMEIDNSKIKDTYQFTDGNNESFESMDIDVSESLEKKSDHETENNITRLPVETAVTQYIQETNKDKLEDVMADMSETIAQEVAIEQQIVEKKKEEEEIISEKINCTKENIETKAKILSPEVNEKPVSPISESTEVSTAVAQDYTDNENNESDSLQRESNFAISDSIDGFLPKRMENIEKNINKHAYDAAVGSGQSMDIIRKRDSSPNMDKHVEIKDSIEMSRSDESITKIENDLSNIQDFSLEEKKAKKIEDIKQEGPKDKVNGVACTKTLEDSKPGLEEETSKTVSFKDSIEDIKETKELVDTKLSSMQLNQNSNNEINPSSEIIAKKLPTRCSRLSNTLDILSDDEEESKKDDQETKPEKSSEKHCINVDDDDDVLLVDDVKMTESRPTNVITEKPIDKDVGKDQAAGIGQTERPNVTVSPAPENNDSPKVNEKTEDVRKEKLLLPENFLSLAKKSVAEMTREELEEFCVLRIVESVLDKTSLNEIKTRLSTMMQNIEEYKKKAKMLTKQNRDLQVVLKSVQEELKKNTNTPIAPLKITRSVGMQVLMVDKSTKKKLGLPNNQNNAITPTKTHNGNTNNNIKQQNMVLTQPIPVPRLVPAAQNTQKTNVQNNQKPVSVTSGPNSIKKTPVPSKAEKRPRSITSPQAVTVDLTDDEPPLKTNRNAVPPVRLVNQQSLMAAKPNTPPSSSPRKVYIPISPQTSQVRPNQTVMLRPPAPILNNTAVRGPNNMRMRMPNSARMMRMNQLRHPAPLPDHVKQYQPPNWKALPPAPDLKLSKVENGIVISWKIDGYQEDMFEEIASYQLYAYQETSVAPSTSLWKKIGDVKALPLPMACTLTQFMTGYKYYFAVRAVDIRSRVGPFSLPGSILLLNKV